MLGSIESAEKQTKFFEKERPWQPVMNYPNAEVLKQQHERELMSIRDAEELWSKNRVFPSVYSMAQRVGLSEVYDFIYNITSDIVHFNPRILLRMGWGDDPRDVQFTTNNFSGYYLRMCQTYGILLLLYEHRIFDLPFAAKSVEIFSQLQQDLENDMRWVESVTYEEMNLKPPDELEASK